MLKSSQARSPSRQRGLSIVELLVGVAIGLFVVAAAAMLVSTQLSDNRRMLLETQIQQDLRATADIITRELRRSGHWELARKGVAVNSTAPASNPYTAITTSDGGAAMADGQVDSTVLLVYSRSTSESTENSTVDDGEKIGFRLSTGVIQTQLGSGNWQALTDANTMTVTAFTLRMDIERNDLACAKDCAGLASCPPTQDVRVFTVDITGQATHDAAVQRSLRSKVRLRNDLVAGACPG